MNVDTTLSEKVQIIIIRIFMSIVGFSCILISSNFSILWLTNYLHIFWASLLGGSMVLFAVFAFETLIVFVSNRWYILTFLVSIVWIIVLAFSMSSTVGVLYNKHIKDTVLAGSEQVESLEWNRLLKQEAELEQLIKEKNREIQIANDQLAPFADADYRIENNDTWLSILITKRKAEAVIQDYRKELENNRFKQEEFIANNSESKSLQKEETQGTSVFFRMLHGITNLPAEKIEFWYFCIPAVFVDIMAPFALAIALFLRKKKFENQHKRRWGKAVSDKLYSMLFSSKKEVVEKRKEIETQNISENKQYIGSRGQLVSYRRGPYKSRKKVDLTKDLDLLQKNKDQETIQKIETKVPRRLTFIDYVREIIPEDISLSLKSDEDLSQELNVPLADCRNFRKKLLMITYKKQHLITRNKANLPKTEIMDIIKILA